MFDEYIEPITKGDYTVRLAKNDDELRQYQDLRYKHLLLLHRPDRIHTDPPGTTDINMNYDKTTSQLCVFYKDPITQKETVVGGYILMRFKTKNCLCKVSLKYDLSKLLDKYMFEVFEASRVVTHPEHRQNSTVIMLLWDGIASYSKKYGVRYLIGTCSFAGTDPLAYNLAASYLYHNYLMDEDIMVTPLDEPKGSAFYHTIIPKDELCPSASRNLPSLLRGYLILGTKMGTGFYIDKTLGLSETFGILDMTKRGRYKIK